MKVMAAITLRPQNPQQHAEMQALTPMEKEHMKTLTEQGIVQTLYVSEDGMQAWGIMEGNTLDQVKEKLENCSLYKYMQADYIPLM